MNPVTFRRRIKSAEMLNFVAINLRQNRGFYKCNGMKARFHANFKKCYKNLRPSEREKFNERFKVFMQDPFLPLLNNHALYGKYAGCRSINITGDIRAIYQLCGIDTAYFIAIDFHSNLYS